MKNKLITSVASFLVIISNLGAGSASMFGWYEPKREE